ncbi:MAG TPA: ABC transporter permease [Baekduia sp.]|nr:ABC transporter permease [Baekduia sp.]
MSARPWTTWLTGPHGRGVRGRGTGRRAGRNDPESPEPVTGIAVLGDIGLFSLHSIRELPRVGPYMSEVLRQAAIIATGSTLIIVMVTFLLGSAVGQEAAAIARALGADPAAATFGCVASTEAINTFIFGYILAAKVGCGMVAEIGSMRVREEVDAIEVMGIRSLTFLVGVRLAGAMLVLPFIYILSIATSQAGSFVNAAIRYGDVSQGTYSFFCFNSIDARVMATSFLHGMVVVVGVILVALYYGWKVRGGPVEVGVATAKSMAVNIVFCTATFLIYDLTFQIRPFLPIA